MQQGREFRRECIIVDTAHEEKDDKGKVFLSVLDTFGKRWKVGQGKGGALKDKWYLFEHGISMWLIIGKYNNYDYVEDAESCLDALEAKAARELADKMRNSKEESIEAQVAVYSITNRICKGVEVPNDLVEGCNTWCRHALRNYMGGKE